MQPGSIAWNGISFHPGERPLRLLDRNTIVLGDGADALQLRWKHVAGRFKPEKHLRKLIKGGGKTAERSAATTHGFHVVEYRGEALEGCVLHKRGTGMTVELQCAPGAPGVESLVDSLRDHSGGRTVPWQTFGLQFRLPAHWLLVSSSFRPGRFSMEYVMPRRKRVVPDAPEKGMRAAATLLLERLAPADALLDGRGLADWAREVWPKEPVAEDAPEPLVVRQETSGLKRLLPGRRNHYGWIRRSEKGNAVLAAFLHSASACAEEFNTITESYGVLSKEDPAEA